MDPIRWEAFLLFKSLFCKYRLQRTRIQSKFVKPVAILVENGSWRKQPGSVYDLMSAAILQGAPFDPTLYPP
jgi:hypothetical protein